MYVILYIHLDPDPKLIQVYDKNCRGLIQKRAHTIDDFMRGKIKPLLLQTKIRSKGFQHFLYFVVSKPFRCFLSVCETCAILFHPFLRRFNLTFIM